MRITLNHWKSIVTRSLNLRRHLKSYREVVVLEITPEAEVVLALLKVISTLGMMLQTG